MMIKMRATGFEPATVGFGVQRSTVGATPSRGNCFASEDPNEFKKLINRSILSFLLLIFKRQTKGYIIFIDRCIVTD